MAGVRRFITIRDIVDELIMASTSGTSRKRGGDQTFATSKRIVLSRDFDDDEEMPGPSQTESSGGIVSGAGSGTKDTAGGRGGAGGLGNVAAQVSNHSSTPYTITSAGTTWINTTDTGNVGIDWTTFPWEFPQLFMSNAERVDLFNNNLFWKAEKVEVTFKNFRGFVNTVPSTGVDVQTFPTDNAAFQTYLDEMYYLGLQSAPFISETGWLAQTDMATLVKSWQKGGYDAANRVALPLTDIQVSENFENIISQNYPNVTQTQGIPGEVVHHKWHTHGDKYWRCTSEFINGMTPTTSDAAPTPTNALIWPNNIRFFRVDQVGGYILAGSEKMPFPRRLFNGIDVAPMATGASVVAKIPPVCYSTPEPIPPLLLRIVPQHIEGNGNSTHIQFDFEIKFHIQTRCKIPRHGYTGSTADFTLPAGITLPGGSEGKNRPGCATRIVPNYPTTIAGSSVDSYLIPMNAAAIQRGRVKNGFIFIPYVGWETAVRVPGEKPPREDITYNTMADFYNRCHVSAPDINPNDPLKHFQDQIYLRQTLDNTLWSHFPTAAVLYELELNNYYLTTCLNVGEQGKTLTMGNVSFDMMMLGYVDPTSKTFDAKYQHSYFFTDLPIPSGTPAGERLERSVETSDARSVMAYLESRITAHLDR